MGKRARRRRAEGAGPPTLGDAPTASYRDDAGNALELRGVLSAKTRAQYVRAREASSAREDAWQRSVELLFERLAVRWEPAGVPYTEQKELLARFRAASAEERAWIRDRLREHVAEHFPELPAP